MRVLLRNQVREINSRESIRFPDMVVTFFELDDAEWLLAVEIGSDIDYITCRKYVETTREYCPWAFSPDGMGLGISIVDMVEVAGNDKFHSVPYNLMHAVYDGETYKHSLPCAIGFYETVLGVDGYKGPNGILRYEGTDINGFVDIYYGSQVPGDLVEFDPK